MSWSAQGGGFGKNVAAEVTTVLDQQKGQNAMHEKVLPHIAEIAKAVAEQYPEHFVTIETNGHMDQYGGMANLAVRVWYKEPARG